MVPKAAWRKKVLILGGSGFVGRHLISALAPDRVIFTYNRTPVEGGVQFDTALTDLSDIVAHPEELSHAVILMGDTLPASCVKDPERSFAVNVKGVERALERLMEWGVTPIFTSSEYVYAGNEGPYSEEDNTNPILVYGRQKLNIERFLAASGADHAVLRLGKIVGSESGDGSLFANWLEAFDRTSSIRCAADQTFSPVYVADVIECIQKAMELSLHGVYNISCSVPYTRLTLLEMLLNQLKKVSPSFTVSIETCDINDFDLPERHPIDVSMTSSKFQRDAGFRFTSMTQVCERIVESRYGAEGV